MSRQVVEAIIRTSHAASPEFFRTSLNGVWLEVVDGAWRVSASDGCILHTSRYPRDAAAVDFKAALIPLADIRKLKELLKRLGKLGEVNIEWRDKLVRFATHSEHVDIVPGLVDTPPPIGRYADIDTAKHLRVKFDLDLLRRLTKSLHEKGDLCVALYLDAENLNSAPIVVEHRERRGVLMPISDRKSQKEKECGK